MSLRSYAFVADTDSIEALRRLRGGWAGWELAEGEFRIRLRDGGMVRAHVDRAEIEPAFEAACVVADFTPGESLIPLRDSPFSSHGNEIAMFRGVTWLEPRPDLGPEHSIQYSAIPGFEIPESAVARCDFTDGFCVTSEQGAIVVRLALRPGWLEVLEDREEVEKFFTLRGFA
jgi:hypothetical protein